MPVTPFHFGPGLALHGASRRIDFWSFAAVNVIIDLESGWNMFQRSWPVHRFMHTFLGASLAILPAALFALLGWRLLRRFGVVLEAPPTAYLLLGAALGAWSHVVLDGMMHADVHPFRPWTDANPLLHLVSVQVLTGGCVAAAVLGAVLAILRLRAAR